MSTSWTLLRNVKVFVKDYCPSLHTCTRNIVEDAFLYVVASACDALKPLQVLLEGGALYRITVLL